ncbi:MAG: hypothetical protein CSA75_00465 [Sorangium cellulosum]|nr:MAG: hypothetical protein CSA75_00465 [Sorangium cellulosum]
MLLIGDITDLHFGTRVLFGGRARKTSDFAPALTAKSVKRMNEHVHLNPVLITLGDVIEDASVQQDQVRSK